MIRGLKLYLQPGGRLCWKRPQNLHFLLSGLTAATFPTPVPTRPTRPAAQQEIRQSRQQTLRRITTPQTPLRDPETPR